MKPYWICRLSLHNSATPYRREHPSTLGRKKQMVVLYHLASYWFQICTINRYIIYQRLILEDVQDSNNISIFVHMCSHNNAADTTSFKYLQLKVADDFCAHWTCHSMRDMRSIHIVDMIRTWLGYWVEEIRRTISWPDWHIPADCLVGVASRASWSHPGDILKMPESQVEHLPFSGLLTWLHLDTYDNMCFEWTSIIWTSHIVAQVVNNDYRTISGFSAIAYEHIKW